VSDFWLGLLNEVSIGIRAAADRRDQKPTGRFGAAYQKLLNFECMGIEDVQLAADVAQERKEVGIKHCLHLIEQLAFSVQANDPNNGW